LLCKSTLAASTDKTTLSGKVTDKAERQPLYGVALTIPDLRTGAATDQKGNYTIDNLPRTKVLVQVSFLGYKRSSLRLTCQKIL